MRTPNSDPTRTLRRLAWAATGLAVALITFGGVVRITGSGMGCGDHWPLCNGEWFPPLDLPTAIEITHRWIAALLSVLIVAVAGQAWRRHRDEPRLLRPALLALVLLVVQVLLGAVTVKLELPAGVVIAHLANAMLLLAALQVTALNAAASMGRRAAEPPSRHRWHYLVVGAAVLGFLVILLGANVANLNAGWVCPGFPLCQGSGLLPPDVPLGTLHWTHRVLAFLFLGAVALLSIVVSRRRDEAADPLRASVNGLLGVTLLQVIVAATMVLQTLPQWLRAAHLLVGTLVWVALVLVVMRSAQTAPATDSPREREQDLAPQPDSRLSTLDSRPSTLSDLVTLTKPRIISLLLVTTVFPMFITGRGLPPPSLVLWVLLGGYLMAGGANAINMWFDRDIDTRMARTRLRPIPSGRISPAAGLAFGVGLGAVAFFIFYRFVNPLSAWLALSGLLFYVVIYTMWLKRSTTQNIVVGGAAGAFPPLVGWAAMTGRIDLAAIYLFAIIFYWTPPHFWALALIKQRDYANAGVPMMPVVRGEQRTKVEMLLYTLFLLPLTLLPSFFGALGPFYLVAAALLGARLLWYCVKLLREDGVTPTAWRMYKYSLLYLALLFAAMGVDRALPFERPLRASNMLPLAPVDSAPAASEHQH
ncbi:MAG TPA: heme o synthase [Gemmatimonadales bacterium]|nr:heme o synthase [Gemmatimonadales bacterium]